MRRLALFVLAPAIAFPAFAANPAITQLVTVAQLESALASSRGNSDGAVSKQLSQMRLTQRLSGARVARLDAALPGHQAREQLEVVADESAFLQLPQEDMLPDPAPDAAAQAALFARVSAYLKEGMEQWPSFSAQQEITRYEGTSTVLATGLRDDLETAVGVRMLRSPAAENWECPGEPRLPSRRVDPIERRSVPMLYRRGHSLHAVGTGGEFACAKSGVNTSDDVGEMLLLIPQIVRDGKAVWDHWEQGALGRLAVLRFAASVNYALSARQEGRMVEVEGEIAIDPEDGGIVRLAQVRRWEVDGYPREYDTVAEFAPVALSGARYLLPARRVAMFLTPILRQRSWNQEMENIYRKFHLDKSPQQEYLNDVRFTGYRVYEPPAGVPGTSLAAKGTP